MQLEHHGGRESVKTSWFFKAVSFQLGDAIEFRVQVWNQV